MGLFSKKSTDEPTGEKRFDITKLLSNLKPWNGKGISANRKSVYYLPAYYRCVEIITTSIAGLPFVVKQRVKDGYEDVKHPVNFLFTIRANQFMNALRFKELLVRDLISKGSHYSVIVREGARPVELLPLPYEHVTIQASDDGVVYVVKSPNKEQVSYLAEDVFHVMGPSEDGIHGMSQLEAHKHALDTALSSQLYIKDFFKGNAMPKGILKYDGTLKPEQKPKIRDSWMSLYGLGGKTMAVLDQGWAFETVSLPPKDAMYLDVAGYTDKQICNIFGIPKHMINDHSDAHYNNVESLGVDLVRFTLTAHVNRIEAEIHTKLLRESEKLDRFPDFNMDGLTRGDMKTRAEYYMKMRQMRAMSANDVRRAEKMNSYEGGDEYDNPMIDINKQTEENGND